MITRDQFAQHPLALNQRLSQAEYAVRRTVTYPLKGVLLIGLSEL
jgi:hypothetical protein